MNNPLEERYYQHHINFGEVCKENAALREEVERLKEAIQEALSELIKDCKYCKVNNCHTQCSDNAVDILRKAARE